MLYILEKQTDAGLSTEATFGACVGSTGENENDSAGNLYIDCTSYNSKTACKSIQEFLTTLSQDNNRGKQNKKK